MAETKRILVAMPVPPLVLPLHPRARPRQANPLPRLGRLVWLLAVFSLPVLGISVADLVHRGGALGAMQVAVSVSPSADTTAPTDAIPARPVGVASQAGIRRDSRA